MDDKTYKALKEIMHWTGEELQSWNGRGKEAIRVWTAFKYVEDWMGETAKNLCKYCLRIDCNCY